MRRSRILTLLAVLLALWSVFPGRLASARPASLPHLLPPSPNAFGYNLEENLDFNSTWIEISGSGTAVDFSGDLDDAVSDPLEIGFAFPYFEYSYNLVYIGTNGFLAFGELPPTASENHPIPADFLPNSLIAAFWDDLALVNDPQHPNQNSVVYFEPGSDAQGSYLVVEYFQVVRLGQINQPLTFEVILRPSGDITLAYQTLQGDLGQCTIGIEDANGVDGLLYRYNDPGGLGDGLAIALTYPATGARVKAFPNDQGSFLFNNLAIFPVSVRNTGSAEDTFNLLLERIHDQPDWQVELVAQDRTTPLQDTNSDGIEDSGPIAPDADFELNIKITAPKTASIGDYLGAELQAISTNDPAKSFTVTFQSAIPANFAQGYADAVQGVNVQFTRSLAQLKSQIKNYPYPKISSDVPTISLARINTHHYLMAWGKRGTFNVPNPSGPIPPFYRYTYYNIEYAMVSPLGGALGSTRVLEDHAGVVPSIGDQFPVAAATPQGQVGMLFVREEQDLINKKTRSNLYFAVMDSNGELQVAPEDVTENTAWRTSADYTAPLFSTPAIAATSNGFALAWVRRSSPDPDNPSHEIDDVFIAQYNRQGDRVVAPHKLTDSQVGGSRFFDPGLIALKGGNLALAYSEYADFGAGSNQYRLSYQIISLNPLNYELVKDHLAGTNGHNVDLAQLADGQILLAWTNLDSDPQQISFAMLDEAGNLSLPPDNSLVPSDGRKADYVSIAPYEDGQAIITWSDNQASDYLYYALLSPEGAVLTPPMKFLRGSNQLDNGSPVDPYIFTKQTGWAIAPLAKTFSDYFPVFYTGGIQ